MNLESDVVAERAAIVVLVKVLVKRDWFQTNFAIWTKELMIYLVLYERRRVRIALTGADRPAILPGVE